jgi:hypothetical protein
MANTVIAIRSSGVTGNTPSLGVLANGELSLNFADGILYYKSSSNTLGSIRTTAVSGLTTEVQFNDAGVFGANANFTFNKSIATLNVKNINVSTNLVTANLTATSITTGTGVGGIIAGANVIYSNVFVANSGGYVQFADGSKQYTANASLSNTQILAGLQTVSPTANITFDTIIVANNGIGRSIRIGDDAWIGDVNLQDTVAIRGAFNAANAYISFGNNDGIVLGRAGSGPLTYGGGIATSQFIQFADGSKQYTANAGSGGTGTTDYGFGQIFTPNNSVYANATSANDKVTFVGESGVYVFANSTTKTITVAGTPGAQGMTVDYGYVSEAVYYSVDYGTL